MPTSRSKRLGLGPTSCLHGRIHPDRHDGDEPHLCDALRRLASFNQVIRFDRRGIGLSDPSSRDSPPTLEQWLDDGEVVPHSVGCERASVLGDRGGALIAVGFAALRPNRVRSLVLINGFGRFLAEVTDAPAEPPPWRRSGGRTVSTFVRARARSEPKLRAARSQSGRPSAPA